MKTIKVAKLDNSKRKFRVYNDLLKKVTSTIECTPEYAIQANKDFEKVNSPIRYIL